MEKKKIDTSTIVTVIVLSIIAILTLFTPLYVFNLLEGIFWSGTAFISVYINSFNNIYLLVTLCTVIFWIMLFILVIFLNKKFHSK